MIWPAGPPGRPGPLAVTPPAPPPLSASLRVTFDKRPSFSTVLKRWDCLLRLTYLIRFDVEMYDEKSK